MPDKKDTMSEGKKSGKGSGEEKESLRKPLEEAGKLAEERLERLKYLQAEFDNYRKACAKERERIFEAAEASIVKDMLTVADDLERTESSMKEGGEKDAVGMVFKNLMKILENRGLRKIEAEGRMFDPHYHEAVLREKSGKEDGFVLQELQKGYVLNSCVIRHSKVKVSEKTDD